MSVNREDLKRLHSQMSKDCITQSESTFLDALESFYRKVFNEEIQPKKLNLNTLLRVIARSNFSNDIGILVAITRTARGLLPNLNCIGDNIAQRDFENLLKLLKETEE